MNPYAYQQAQLQPHQQQYQYQTQYAQPQQYYYVQPSATTHQGFQTPNTQLPFANAHYGTVGYQNPQGVGAVGQYHVQGYNQAQGTQQYVVPGQSYYAPTSQTNANQGFEQTQHAPSTAAKEAPPPLPPEQSDSAAPPPLPPEPSPTYAAGAAPGFSGATSGGQSAAEQIVEAQKQYQEKFAQWQQQYAQWQAQHQHHPDQKQYHEWQKQMQQWQQQNQNLIQQQVTTSGVKPQDQGQVAAQPQQQAVQSQQHQQIASQHHQHQHQLQHQTQPYGQQLYPQQHQQSQPHWLQNTSTQNQQAGYEQSHDQTLGQQQQQQQQQSQLHQQQNPNRPQEGLHFQTKTVTSLQGHKNTAVQNHQGGYQQSHDHTLGQQQQQQQSQLHQQQNPNRLQEALHFQNKTGTSLQGQQNTSVQNQQGGYQQSHDQALGRQQQQQQQQQSQLHKQQNPNRSQEGLHFQNKINTSPQGYQRPKWMQSSKAPVLSSSQEPKWMQAANFNATGSQQDRPAVANNETKKPQWLHQEGAAQQQTTEGASRQQQEQTDTPRWLQEKLEKTERDMKQAAAEKALKEKEAEQRQPPKWMQSEGVNNKEAQNLQRSLQNQMQEKVVPKWLQQNPVSAGNQPGHQEKAGQMPKWLQGNTSAIPNTTTQAAPTPALPTLKKPSKWDQEDKIPSSVTAPISKKLDPLREIELLRQQQEQLQKLQQIEKRLKQTPPPSSTTATVSTSSSINTSQTRTMTFSSWAQDGATKQGMAPQQSNKAQESGHAETSVQQINAKPPCKFFPNCRFGQSCHFQHPSCKFGTMCNKQECMFDHNTDSAVEVYPEESHDQYPEMASYTDEPESYSSSMSQWSSRVDQIPGIGDGEMPVVPAETQDSTVTDDTTFQPEENTYHEDTNNYKEDNMEIEEDQNTDGNLLGITVKSEPFPTDTTQSAAVQDNKSGEDWQQSSQHDWGHGDAWSGPPPHPEELAGDRGIWEGERLPPGSDWPPHGERFSRWEGRDGHPLEGDARPPLPREGEGDGLLDRKDWRPPPHEWESGPPFPRGDQEFGPGRFQREWRPPFLDMPERRPPFPPDELGRRPPWSDERDGRRLFPGGDREPPPFARDERGRPPFPRDDWDRDGPPFPRDFRDGRPPPPRGREDHPFRDSGPPLPEGEREHIPPESQIKHPLVKEEKVHEGQANKEQDDKHAGKNKPPLLKNEQDKPSFPASERDRPPFLRDDRDSKPPFPRDGRDGRPPFARDERDRPPFPRDERDRPPFLRDDRDRPPFPRDERERPPFPRDEWDRPPFGRGDHDFPFPPRGGRGRWPSPPPPRDERDRWAPFPRDDRDIPEWERGRGPPGRPMSPRGRDGGGRPPFHEHDRGRPKSPPPWHPLDHPRRPWSPPRRDLMGRPPPPPEEFDRFGRPPPPPPPDAEFFDDRGRPPWDWDRGDWRRPPDDEWPRERHYPDDRRPRSPPPRWDHPDHLPPRFPSDWERDHRRGPDDRWFDERGPPDRRPPHDDLHRDRPPYPDDPYPRDPSSYPPHPDDVGPPSEPPRIEKKPETVPVESILDLPGRENRPDRIVIILRGPPGSGKTHVARLIKDKEVSHGAHAPRILALDDYFLMEVEKSEQDPDTGKKVKKKVTEYVYEEEMEEAYRNSLFKSFSKTLEDGFFPVVIVDAIHDKVEHFEKYWSHAKQKGFEVYVAELMADAHACAKRNSHNRTFEDINKMVAAWEETPAHHLRLDVRSLLQDAVITEVEMEAADQPDGSGVTQEQDPQPATEEEAEEEPKVQVPSRSKWDDMEPAEDKLNKLDGIRPMKGKRKREESPPFPLSDDDDPYDEREEDMRIGKKRVRWADLEEKKQLEHRRRIGFCIGTDWSLLTDPHAEIPRM